MRACAMGMPFSATTCPVSVPPCAGRLAGRSNAPRNTKRRALRTGTVTDDDGLVADLQHPNVEDHGGVGRDDDLAGVVQDRFRPEPEGRWNDEPASGATAHADHALFEPVDERAGARREYQRAADVDRAVEFPAVEEVARIVDGDRVAPWRPISAARVTGNIAQPARRGDRVPTRARHIPRGRNAVRPRQLFKASGGEQCHRHRHNAGEDPSPRARHHTDEARCRLRDCQEMETFPCGPWTAASLYGKGDRPPDS